MNAQDSIVLGAGIAILVGIFLVLMRAFLGPSIYDRILAMNTMGTKTVIFVALLGFIMKRSDFLDIALAYALVNFVGTIAILKYVEFRKLG
jgi:multicomponent Na+:H+ antiporter subunit F